MPALRRRQILKARFYGVLQVRGRQVFSDERLQRVRTVSSRQVFSDEWHFNVFRGGVQSRHILHIRGHIISNFLMRTVRCGEVFSAHRLQRVLHLQRGEIRISRLQRVRNVSSRQVFRGCGHSSMRPVQRGHIFRADRSYIGICVHRMQVWPFLSFICIYVLQV